jgi:hypothetical protein
MPLPRTKTPLASKAASPGSGTPEPEDSKTSIVLNSYQKLSKHLLTYTSFTEYTENKFRGLKMPNITLSIPDELKKQLDQLPELNISESVRKFLTEKAKRALLLKELDKSLENSELTDEDALRLGRELKERAWKRYKKEGW